MDSQAQGVTKLITRYYLPFATKYSWLYSTASAGMSTEDKQSTWWLVIRLSPNVEPSKVLMAVVIF